MSRALRRLRRLRDRRLPHRLTLAEFRTILAFSMVVVAILGAIAADRAAQGEFAAAVNERRLDQGQMLEIQYRQSLLDLGNKGAEFARRRDELRREGESALDAAKELRKSGSSEDLHAAVALELQGQEKLLRERLYQVFDNLLVDTKAQDSTISWEDALSRSVARKLQRVGFDVQWHGAELAAGSKAPAQHPSIWQTETREMETAHIRGPGLAWDVFVFVLALFCLVIAVLLAPSTHVASGFAGAGLIIGTGCAVFIAVQPTTEPWAHWTMLGLPISAALLALGAWWSGLLSWLGASRHAKHRPEKHLPEPPHPEINTYPGAHMTAREADDLISKGTVILLASTVLLSAYAGYNYSSASAETNKASLDGFAQQIEMIKRSTRPTAEALNEFDAMAQILDQRIECAALNQQIVLLRNKVIETDEKELAARKGAVCSIPMGPVFALARQALDGNDGIDSDPHFPVHYYNLKINGEADNAAVAFARWDGDTQLALFWGGKATAFLTILTLCAIALFLLGQALGIGRSRLANMLVVTALAFDIYALTLTVGTTLQPSDESMGAIPDGCTLPPDWKRSSTPVEVAAYFFAQGKMTVENATSSAGFAEAARELTCTTKARPKFALGLYYYTTALSQADFSLGDQPYIGEPDLAALRDIVSNRKATIDSMDEERFTVPSSLFNSYGIALWHDAIFRSGPYDERRIEILGSIEAYQKAIKAQTGEADEDARASTSDPSESDLLPYLNMGLSYLSLLDFAKAKQLYIDALKAGAGNHADLVANALSALEVLSAYCPGLYKDNDDDCARLDGEIRRDKAALISGSFDSTPTGAPGKIADPDAYVGANAISWRFKSVTLDPSKDRLRVAWYVSDAMPASITSSGAPEREAYGPWRALPRVEGQDDVSQISPPYESAGRYYWELHQTRNEDASCYAGGKYRAEFYVNGAKVLTHDFPMSFYGFTVTRWHQLGIAFCRPASWRAWQAASRSAEQDLVQGLETKEGTPVVFAFTFFSPATLPGNISKEDYFLNRALQYLRNAAVLPGDGSPPATIEQACARGAPMGGFIGKVWATPEGVHVGLVLGKALAAEQACDVALSISSL